MLPFLHNSSPQASTHVTSKRRQRETLALACLPVISHWQTRAQYEPAIPLALEIATIVIAILLLLKTSSTRIRIASVATLFAFPLLIGISTGIRLGQPLAVEVLMLTLFGAFALALAVAYPTTRLLSLSVICAGFLALFVCLSSDRQDAILIPVLWLLICMWHLVANHWERLDVCMARSVQRSHWIRPLSVFLAMSLVLGVSWLTFNRVQLTRARAGVMPTSGGSQWDAPNARSGIGSGDLAIAAEKNASSFGAVDSEVMLESHESSLFDMFNETAGEPIKTRQDDPAQALRGPTVQQPHTHASKTDKGGQAFTTARQAPESLSRKQGNIDNDDILQWIGPTGIRLGMERFDSFDGFVWTSTGTTVQKNLPQVKVGEDLWSIAPNQNLPVDFSECQLGSLRVIRLNSAHMATPMMTKAVNIKDVERNDFYGIDTDGSWFMPGRKKIPTLSVLHFLSDSVLEDHLLRPNTFNDLAASSANSSLMPTEGMRTAAQLAHQWSDSCQLPYEKISSTINHLRSFAVYDPSQGSDPRDPLLAFLENKRGGAYLFATAAATMLQSLGFEVRLATGFYVSPDRYESTARHTPIRKEDVHTWVEVKLADGRWIEVEPTPGFHMPQYKQSWQRIAKNLAVLAAPYLVLCTVCGLILFWLRATWLNWLASSLWFLTKYQGEKTQLLWTVRLLEIRAILAKSPRDSGLNQREWLLRIASSDPSLAASVRHYCDIAEQVSFGGKAICSEWQTAARQMLTTMNVHFFRNHSILTSAASRVATS